MKKIIPFLVLLFIGTFTFAQKDTTPNRGKPQVTKTTPNASGVKRSIGYKFNSIIEDKDPGSGIFRYNNKNAASVTYIFVDKYDIKGEDQTNWYETWEDTTGATGRGQLVLVELNGENVNVFDVTGVFIDGNGYWKFPVEYVSGKLPANDSVYFYIFNRIAHNDRSDNENQSNEDNQAPPVTPVTPDTLVTVTAPVAPVTPDTLVTVTAPVAPVTPDTLVTVATPVAPVTPDTLVTVTAPVAPVTPDTLVTVVTPVAPVAPDTLVTVAAPVAPVTPDTLVTVVTPVAPVTLVTVATPVAPVTPDTLVTVAAPVAPVTPDTLVTVTAPVAPVTPDTLVTVATPVAPVTLVTVAAPVAPVAPVTPDTLVTVAAPVAPVTPDTLVTVAAPVAPVTPDTLVTVVNHGTPRTQVDERTQRTTVAQDPPRVTETRPEPKPQETTVAQGPPRVTETKPEPKTQETTVAQGPPKISEAKPQQVTQGTTITQGTQSVPATQPSQETRLNEVPVSQNYYESSRVSKGKCYRGIIEIGYALRISEYGMNNFRFNFINGFNIGHTSIGLGIGVRKYYDKPANHPDWHLVSSDVQIPVFLDVRTTFSSKKVTPYLGIGIGNSTGFDTDTTKNKPEGLYFHTTGGIWFNISDRFAVFGGFAYELQGLEFANFSDEIPFKKYTNSISLNIGIAF